MFMFLFLRASTTAVNALLAGLLALAAGLLIALSSQELRAQASWLVNEQAPAVIRNITDALGAVRNLGDPPR